jgi:hypothetical protein
MRYSKSTFAEVCGRFLDRTKDLMKRARNNVSFINEIIQRRYGNHITTENGVRVLSASRHFGI